jgi:hypothetical protein
VLSLIRMTRLNDIIYTHQRLEADFPTTVDASATTPASRARADGREARSVFRRASCCDPAYGPARARIRRGNREGAPHYRRAATSRQNGRPGPRQDRLALSGDGTFMPESEKLAARLEEYERHAAGGRARAAAAPRSSDGTFLPGSGPIA